MRNKDEAYSWEIVSDNEIIKTCDKSFFKYGESGIPKDISYFFEIEDMYGGERREINIIFEEQTYEAYFRKDITSSGRFKIMWDGSLRKTLSQFGEIKDQALRACFCKITKSLYKLSFVNYSIH